MRRELIVVELFPRVAPIPRNLADVTDRMIQLRYASRIELDRKFFDKIDHVIDLVREVDRALPPDSAVRKDPEYKKLLAHRKIDRFHVVTANFAPGLGNASDFSPTSVQARIETGYRDALEQGIGESSDAPDGPAHGPRARPQPSRALAT